MTKAEQFEALAQRCEQATGPDGNLNKAILRALGYTWRGMDYWHYDNKRTWRNPSIFTASLDAARSISDAMLIHASEIGADGLPMVGLVADTSTSPPIEHTGIARTLELAWCAAALRARAQMERGK